MRLICIVFLILPSFAGAQMIPRNLLQKNLSAEQLQKVLLSHASFKPFPQTPDEWKKILPDSMLRQIVKGAENVLKEPFPNIPATVTLDFSRNGDRIRYESILFGKRYRLWAMVLAESIEGKKRFLDAIVDGIWSIAEESFWGATAHLFIQKEGKGLPDVEEPVVDLFVAETAANLAMADYFLGPQLDSISPLVRRRIYYEVNRRVFIPLQTARYEWMGYGDSSAKLNNWAPWIMSNYLTAALFLEKDATRRIQFVAKVMQLTDQYINGIGDDGGIEEGAHYWSFGVGCVLDILNLLSSASNGSINIYNDNVIRNMGAYIYRTHISGNYFVNVGDSHAQLNPDAVMVWRFGQLVTDKNLSSFGSWLYRKDGYTMNPSFHRARTLFDLVSLQATANDNQLFIQNSEEWLPQVGMMVARLSNGLFIAAHGGHNGESHNHNDVGDFIIYTKGEPVIIDVGPGTYTSKTFSKDRYTLWFNTSAYHNLPMINYYQQSEGSDHAASNVSFKKGKGETVLTMNMEKAYPAVADLISWKRTIVAGNESILVDDRFAARNTPGSLTQSFMTVCEVNINSPEMIEFTTVQGNKVTLHYGSGWRVSKEVLPLSGEEDQGLKRTWRNLSIVRILLTRLSPAKTGHFRYTISSR